MPQGLKFALILLAAIGVALAAVGLWLDRPGETTWEPVSATIVSADLEKSWERGPGLREMWVYAPRATYSWSIGGQTFAGDTVALPGAQGAGLFYDERSAAYAMQGWEPGARVEAWVDADDPSRAVLLKPGGGGVLLVGVGGLLVLTAAGAAIAARRRA